MFEELLAASHLALHGVDTYLPFAENQLARAAVTRLCPTTRQSPVSGSLTLIYGPAGVGKSHLVRWTLQELTRKHPRLIWICATVQDLCEQMQREEQSQSLAEFLEGCQALDVLVCEDLHQLVLAPSLQPYFAMLIEALEESVIQILITSNQPVGQIRVLDQKLVSRCHGGLCVSMPLPNLESRVLLLQQWFQEFRLPILKPFSASTQFLAEKLPISPRELRYAVKELSVLQGRQPAPIDVAYLERWVAAEGRSPRLSFEAIVLQVAQEFGVEPHDLRSRSRQQGLAVPRQCAMWLARELTGRSLNQIGEYFDRSHTTVSHSLSKLNELLPTVPTLRQQVQKLRLQLKQLPHEDCA